MKSALPLAKALQRFTDPVIVAALLRGVAAAELACEENEAELPHVLERMANNSLEPMLAAEVLSAEQQRKLPRGVSTAAFRGALTKFSPETCAGLEYLLGDK